MRQFGAASRDIEFGLGTSRHRTRRSQCSQETKRLPHIPLPFKEVIADASPRKAGEVGEEKG